MFYYEPQTGVIRIPKWVYSELKDLFIVPPAFLTILKRKVIGARNERQISIPRCSGTILVVKPSHILTRCSK